MVSVELFAQIESQDSTFNTTKSDTTLTFIRHNVAPQMGLNKFFKAVHQELHYPEKAIKLGIQGKVYVQFIVEKSGELSNFRVIRGLGHGCDEEALRTVKKITSLDGKWQQTQGFSYKKMKPAFSVCKSSFLRLKNLFSNLKIL